MSILSAAYLLFLSAADRFLQEYANVAKEVAGPNAPLVDHSLPVPQPDHYASKALWSQGKFRYLPARIIMYRDGVSDGEFNHVIRVGGGPSAP